jgi:hypothetical protein
MRTGAWPVTFPAPVWYIARLAGEAGSQESVGLGIDLLPWWESGLYFPDFSLRRMTMRLKILKICSRSPTMLATVT